jgi:hypothetical protein
MDMKTKPAYGADNNPAKPEDKGFPLPKAIQLFLPLQSLVKTVRANAIHPSRKRRRAETNAPGCPL